MSKIICEVCGTRYPDTAAQCPICGKVHGNENDASEQEVQAEELVVPSRPAVKGGRFSKKNVRKRLKNQAVYEEPEVVNQTVNEAEEESEEDFEEEEVKKGGTLVNVLLVFVIIALLAVSSYIFLEYFMPNFMGGEPAELPTTAVVEETEAPTEAPTETPTEAEPTEPPTVPCQQLVLDITDITLREAGAMYLLNVQMLPEDSTDTIMYISSNEDVATVNEEGRVTAVGEGAVVITAVCGDQQLECNVVCDFAPEETEVPTEAPTEAPTEPPFKDVKLSVKVTDTTLRTRGQQTPVVLTCDLDFDEVTWTSENEDIATVGDGVITRVGSGTTKIIGTYGDQKVEIIVRCPKK